MEVAFEAFCSILWSCARHTAPRVLSALSKGFVRCGGALELLAGRGFVDVVLHQVCQMLLVEFLGQKACWTCVRFRRLISLTGWDRCNFIVIVIIIVAVAH